MGFSVFGGIGRDALPAEHCYPRICLTFSMESLAGQSETFPQSFGKRFYGGEGLFYR